MVDGISPACVGSASGSATTGGQFSDPATAGSEFSGPPGRRTCREWNLGQDNHVGYYQSLGAEFPQCRTRSAGHAGRASSHQFLGSSGSTAPNGGSALLRSRRRFSLLKLGACPTLTFLLRQTM